MEVVEHEAKQNETIVTSDVTIETATNEVLNQENAQVESYFKPQGTEQDSVEVLSEDIMAVLNQAPSFQSTSNITSRCTNAKLTVVLHQVSNRSKLSKDVYSQLNVQEGDFVDVRIANKQVFVQKATANKGLKVGKNGWLYNKDFVTALVNEFGLTFGMNTDDEEISNSSAHLLQVEYKQYKGQVLAIITP